MIDEAARLRDLKRVCIGAAVCLALALIALYASFPSAYNATTWLLSYHDGAFKRGLLPEIHRLVWGSASGQLSRIKVSCLASFALTVTSLLLLGRAAIQRARDRFELAAAASALALCIAPPAGLAYLAIDLARPATFNYALAMSALLVLIRSPSANRGALVAGLLCAIMPLIHETALATTFPVVLGACLARAADGQQRPAVFRAIALSVIPILVTTAAVVASHAGPVQPPAADFPLDRLAIEAPSLSLSAQWAANLDVLHSRRGMAGLLSALVNAAIGMGSMLFAIAAFTRDGGERIALMRKCWLPAVISALPLALCVITYDYGRWIADALFNVSALALFALAVPRTTAPDPARSVSTRWAIPFAVSLLLQLAAGPLHPNEGSTPVHHRFLQLFRVDEGWIGPH